MMNLFHRWYCQSGRWRERVQGTIVPGVLGDLDLGESALELGPGPGLTTDVIRTKVPHLTAIELDRRLASRLKARLAGTNVTVVEGDATAMPFGDAEFTGAVCLTMLHHVPSADLQDRLLREVHRVLKPGSWFAGSDSTPRLRWHIYHLFDTKTPVDPDGFPDRLKASGFSEVSVTRTATGFRWRAKA